MKRLSLLSVLTVAAVALFVSPATTSATDKVVICHHNVDDPSEAEFVTISVASSAVDAHLAHGDTLGACPVQ